MPPVSEAVPGSLAYNVGGAYRSPAGLFPSRRVPSLSQAPILPGDRTSPGGIGASTRSAQTGGRARRRPLRAARSGRPAQRGRAARARALGAVVDAVAVRQRVHSSPPEHADGSRSSGTTVAAALGPGRRLTPTAVPIALSGRNAPPSPRRARYDASICLGALDIADRRRRVPRHAPSLPSRPPARRRRLVAAHGAREVSSP